MKRSKNKIMETSGNRERYTRQYAFSSICGAAIADISLPEGQGTAVPFTKACVAVYECHQEWN